MRIQSKWVLHIPYVIIVALATSYFLLSYDRGLNPIDEGVVLYNFQKVANGQVPHRDFHDLYGPAAYWVGGVLFRLFGSKIIIARVSLLILKVIMALLIFLIARKLMPQLFAIIASVLFILNWGDPLLPAFNIMQAGHFSHFFMLLGIFLMILYLERGDMLWLLATSASIGVSMLFKFHTAIITLMGFAVFLSLKEQVHTFGTEAETEPGAKPEKSLLFGLRAGKCLGAICVVLFYLMLFAKYHLDLHLFFIFLFPFYFFLGCIILVDLQSFRSDRVNVSSAVNLKKCYAEVFILFAGPVSAWVLQIAYYMVAGGLDEFMYDMFVLPLRIDYYRQMMEYRLHAGLIAAAAALVIVMLGIARSIEEKGEAVKASLWRASVVFTLLLPIGLILNRTPFEEWHMRTTHILPTTTLLLTVYLFLGKWRTYRLSGGNTKEMLYLGLLFVLSAQGFLTSFPRTDEAHIQINLSAIFILMAFLLWKLYEGWKSFLPKFGRTRGLIAVLACLTILVTPYVWSMQKLLHATTELHTHEIAAESPGHRIADWKAQSMLVLPFPRCAGISIPMRFRFHFPDIWIDITEIVQFLRMNTTSDERIFVFCELQIIYYLAERESVVQKENYLIHLAAMGLIDSAGDVRLTDEQLLEKMQDALPRFIVRARKGNHTKRIAATWPQTAEFIEKNYQPLKKVGGIYEILCPLPSLYGNTPLH